MEATYTDWDKECESLKEYLKYWIDFEQKQFFMVDGLKVYFNTTGHMANLLNEMGILFTDLWACGRSVRMTFEEWKSDNRLDK